ncbi:MAG: envelope stress response membrane protein PspC [Rudaea sp.]
MKPDGEWRTSRFYRDPRNGKLMGVCAGLADYFRWNVTFVRILAVITLIWFGTFTAIAYLVLGFMLPDKPDRLYDWDTDDKYRSSVRRSADETFRDMRHRFRELDRKLQRLENYVTSSRYDLDRQFRNLKD